MRWRTRAVESTRPARGRKRSARSPAAKSATGTDPLLGLQSTAGNAAVSSLVQRKEEDAEAGVPATKQESGDLYDQGSTALNAGRYEEAQRIFERLLAGGYRHREALHTLVWNLAICKANLGDFDGAYELAITYGHYGGGRADEQKLLERVEQLRAADAGNTPGEPIPRTKNAAGELFEKASAALAGADYAEAASLFETLLASPVRHDEALPTIVWNLALCKANLGDFDRAYDLALQYSRFRTGGDDQKLLQQIESVRQGLVGESTDATTPKTSEEASTLFDKASASLKAQQFEEAKRMFEMLLSSPIKHNQAMPTIVWNLAICRAHLGDFDGARRLALTYTQYRGTEDDERQLFVQIEQLQHAAEASPRESPATAVT